MKQSLEFSDEEWESLLEEIEDHEISDEQAERQEKYRRKLSDDC